MSKVIKILAIASGVLLVLFFISKRSEKTEPAPPGPGAPAQQEETAGFSISPEDADVAACKGGSLSDILASYGKTWGSSADSSLSSVIKGPDVKKLTAALDEYAICRAFGSKDEAMCGFGSMGSGGEGLFYSHIAAAADGANCMDALKDFHGMEYLAGQRKEISACERLMSDILYEHPKSGIKGISSKEFCAVAATGMENICAGLLALDQKGCRKLFPARESDCGGDDDCLEDLGLYTAVKTGDPANCSAETRGYCRMYLSKSKVSCADLAATVSQVYCSALAKAGGYSSGGMKK